MPRTELMRLRQPIVNRLVPLGRKHIIKNLIDAAEPVGPPGPRPEDFIGIRPLVTNWTAADFDADLDFTDLADGETLTIWFGATQQVANALSFIVANVSTTSNSAVGTQIPTSTPTNGGRVFWQFNSLQWNFPDDLTQRHEYRLELTRSGANFNGRAFVDGVESTDGVVVIPVDDRANFNGMGGRLEGSSARSDLFHLQFLRSDTGAFWKFLIDEGSGGVTVSEGNAGDVTATMSQIEDTDWKWWPGVNVMVAGASGTANGFRLGGSPPFGSFTPALVDKVGADCVVLQATTTNGNLQMQITDPAFSLAAEDVNNIKITGVFSDGGTVLDLPRDLFGQFTGVSSWTWLGAFSIGEGFVNGNSYNVLVT